MTDEEKFHEAVRSYLRITGPVFTQDAFALMFCDDEYRREIERAADADKPKPRKLKETPQGSSYQVDQSNGRVGARSAQASTEEEVMDVFNGYACLRCGMKHLTKRAAEVCAFCEAKEMRQNIEPKLTGGSSSHYVLDVTKPLEGKPYRTQCLDVIMALRMTFEEGEVFKAIWRKAAARQGNGKPGNSALYNAEKVAFFGQAMVKMEGE